MLIYIRERYICRELLIDIKYVTGFFITFETVVELIKNEINDTSDNTNITKWCRLEGYLYVLKYIIDKSIK